jgi:sodium transport system ATP-binding protein
MVKLCRSLVNESHAEIMIRVTHLTKHFPPAGLRLIRRGGPDGHLAVDDVSFECHPGRIFCLLGPNGAGKTTTMRILATMLRPTSGLVEVAGIDAASHPDDVRRHLGFLTGATALYDRLTPDEIVDYYGTLHGVDGSDLLKRRDEYYDLLDMHTYRSTRVGRLSTGMKQKVSIVRAMIHDPEVVIFDEVTSGLDVIGARSIIALVRRCRELGKTVIFSTHRMDEVSLLADDLGIMMRGRLQFAGSFESFVENRNARTIEDEFIRLVEAA